MVRYSSPMMALFKRLTIQGIYVGSRDMFEAMVNAIEVNALEPLSDKFRAFVFGSTLLDRFDVDEDFVHLMKEDDEALLRFGFLWVRFALFAEPTMKMKPEAVQAVNEKMEKKSTSKNPTPESSQEEAQ